MNPIDGYAQSTDIQQESPKAPISVRESSKISTFPAEILQRIFKAFVSFDITLSRNSEVLCISQVSPDWRQVAIETPELWSSLAILISHVPHDRRSRTTHTSWEFVETWLERNKGRDLSLSILGDAPFPPGMALNCLSCLKLVEIVFIRHARSICYFHGLTTDLLTGLAYYPGQQPLLSLRSLIFHPESFITDDSIPFLSIIAPNLRRLRVDSLEYILLAAPQTRVYSEQITHLTTYAAGHMVTGIFQAFSNLESIVLYYQYDPQSDSSPPDDVAHDIFLPKLSSLTIMLLNSHPLDLSLFRFLKMPVLQTFRLGSFHQAEFSFFSELPTDLQLGYEQIARIRQLCLFFDYLGSEQEMERFFSNIPDLEELDIQDCLDYEIFFSRLNRHRNQRLVNNQPHIMPLLRTLTLDIRQMAYFTLQNPCLMGFINTQLLVEPLFRVLVYVSGNARAIYAPMVEMAKQAGLPIDLVVWDKDSGSRGDRWKYRMQRKFDRWATGSTD